MRCLCPGASGCLYWAGCPQDMAGPHWQQGPVGSPAPHLLVGWGPRVLGREDLLCGPVHVSVASYSHAYARAAAWESHSTALQPWKSGLHWAGAGPPSSICRTLCLLPALAASFHRTQETQGDSAGGRLGPSAPMAGSRKAVIRCLRAQPLPQALYCEPWTLGTKGTVSTVQQTCPSVSLWGPLETNTVDGFPSINKLHSQN